jgi:hypothetical protein
VAATAAAATTAAVVASKHQQKKEQADPATSDLSHPSPSAPPASEDTSYYKVTVPAGVAPGCPFKVDVGGKKFEVTCPPDVRPGQKIRVELPRDTGRRKRSKSPKKPNDQGLHYVIVPNGISAGMPFRVNAGGTQFTVNCPQNARAGQRIAVRVPRDSRGRSKSPKPPPSSHGSVPQPQNTKLQQHYVNVPPNVYPGMPFQVDVRGQRFKVTCPANAQPGQRIAVTLPTGGAGRPSRSRTPPRPAATTTRTEYFDAVIPAGVGPGQKFKIRAHGKDVIVKCPSNVGPGQKVRVPVTVSGGVRASGTGGYRTPSHSPVRLHNPGVGGYGGGGYVTSNPGAGERNLQPYV